jgi:hypothetical protein
MNEFLEYCQKGPRAARVTQIDQQDIPVENGEATFVRRKTGAGPSMAGFQKEL